MAEPRPIPLLEPDIGEDERRMVDACLRENWVSSAGPYVTRFEAALAARCHRRFAISTASGTTALHLLLITAGIGHGDRVILPDWTFAATANAVIHAGATPIFVDVNGRGALESTLITPLLEQPDHRVRAIIAVDPPGDIADFAPLQEIASHHGLLLIEDAAGALGSYHHEQPAGSFGDASVLSFNGNKILTTGAGGAILTDDATLAERARHLAAQARVGAGYDYDAIGFNCRMAAVNAALGLAQINRLDETLIKRRSLEERYHAALNSVTGIQLFTPPDHIRSNGWMTCIRLKTPDAAQSLLQHLHDQGIQARTFWNALSDQQPFAAFDRIGGGQSLALSGTVVSLPSSTGLPPEHQQHVIEAVMDWATHEGG